MSVLSSFTPLRRRFALAAAQQALLSLARDERSWLAHPDSLAFLRAHAFVPVGSDGHDGAEAADDAAAADADDNDDDDEGGSGGAGATNVRPLSFARASDLYEPRDTSLYTNNVGRSFRLEDILPARLFPHPGLFAQFQQADRLQRQQPPQQQLHKGKMVVVVQQQQQQRAGSSSGDGGGADSQVQSMLVTALRRLGIRTTLQRRDIIFAATHMTSTVQAANLLAYLDSHFDRYFIDSSSVGGGGSWWW